MEKKEIETKCLHNGKVKEILPNIFYCELCKGIFGRGNGSDNESYVIFISNDIVPKISAISKLQAQLIVQKNHQSGSIINLDKVRLTKFNLNQNIDKITSLSSAQKQIVINKFKDYGFKD